MANDTNNQETLNNEECQQQQTDNQQSGTVLQNTIDEIDEDREENVSLDSQRQIELEEEKKLKAKHPCIQRPGSEFLQKRLQRGQKYFDSGDYNMAKASPTNPNVIKLPEGTQPVPAIDGKLLSKQRQIN